MSKLAIAIITSIIAGCVSTGKQISEDDVKKIKIDHTTYDELIAILGKPNSEMEITQNGTAPATCAKKGVKIRNVSYTHASGGLTGGFDSESRIFYINPKNIVCDISTQKNSY